MDKRQLSTAETFTRALWLVDNSLLDARPSIPSDQLKTSLNKRMSALGLGDELSSLRAIDRFLQTPPQLLQVVDELCTRLFELRGGLPMLRQDSLARRLARVIDLDALKCLHPNLKLPSDEKFDWAVVPMASDDGAGLLRDGSVDTHIHLGGSLAPLFYWLALVGGEFPLEALRWLSSLHRGHADAYVWQNSIATAMWSRFSLAAWLQHPENHNIHHGLFSHLPHIESPLWRPFESEPKAVRPRSIIDTVLALNANRPQGNEHSTENHHPGDPLCTPSSEPNGIHYAEGERRLLVGIARYMRRAGKTAKIEQLLLGYLRIRNAFHQVMCHDIGAEGLMRFLENFGRRSFQFRSRQPRHQRGRRQRRYRREICRLERRRVTAALDAQLVNAFEERALDGQPKIQRGMEMRVSVPSGHYFLPVLRAWLDGIYDHLCKKTDCSLDSESRLIPDSQVGLLFHFIKTGNSANDIEIANNSASRLAAILTGYPGLRRFIIGVDAAGDERRAPPRTFGQAFTRLRELQHSHRPIDSEAAIELGFTYHVGEDLDDMLTGLRHMEEVVIHLLNDQGRIGHGLVLGIDVEGFYQQRGGEVELTTGAHLLDLVWAWGRLVHEGMIRLVHWVESLIYTHFQKSMTRPRVQDCYRSMDMEWSARNTTGDPVGREPVFKQESELLQELGFEGDSEAPITLNIGPQWIELVATLQQLVRERLAHRRVTIEVNPTSNLIIGGYRDYAELPYQTMVENGLTVSINTDDPGLFMTSLPNEYASLYQALVGPMNHRDAAAWLEARHRDGTRSTFLGRNVPVGITAYELLSKKNRKLLFKYQPPTDDL